MSIQSLPFKVKTKVSWPGEEEGDLGFIENEIVEVFSIVDDSWWSGKLRRNGAEGIFPKDYVEIIEDKLNHSSSSQSLTSSKHNTPIKDNEYDSRYRSSKSNTPINNYTPINTYYSSSKVSQKKINSFNNPDTSYDYENEGDIRINTSYENMDSFSRSSKANGHYYPKKVRSANQLVSSMNHPKNKHLNQQQEELLRLREREIQNFKLLQQQHNYHIKKSSDNQKRMSFQQEECFRNSTGSPEIYNTSPSAKSKLSKAKRPQSQIYLSQGYHSNNVKSISPINVKSQSYNDVSIFPQSMNQLLFKNHTVESLSPDNSPQHLKQKSVLSKHVSPKLQVKDESGFLDDYDKIAYKRQQLEEELEQLKQLEKSNQKKRFQYSKSSSATPVKGQYNNDIVYDTSIDSSYVSEDLLSSKKNFHSRDDLGKKLARCITGEGEDDECDIYQVDEGLCSGSPPPPPPKHTTPIKSFNTYPPDEVVKNSENMKTSLMKRVPYDADDFKFSGQSNPKFQLTDEEIFQLSQMQHEELKNSIKSLQSDVLNLSELSATSAGSFIRHKYEKEQQELNLKHLSINEKPNGSSIDFNDDKKEINKQLIDTIFQDKKSRHPNIFKKLLQKRKEEDSTNLIEQKLQKEEEIDWTTLKMELNRMNSLTSQDKQVRTKRIVREESSLIVKPLDYISEININEILGDLDSDIAGLDLNNVSFKKVDVFMERYTTSSDLNEIISDITIKFNSSKLNQIRCVLIHLCKFHIIEESNKISQIKPKLNEVLYKGEASIYQLNYLFKKILDALRIPSEIVLGFWKKPNEFYHNDQYTVNHCWLSILIENQFLTLDLYCFKNGSVCNIRDNSNDYNEFYFLTKPLNLVSTHIPSIIDLQHVVPPIDQNVAFYLPRVYSGYHKYKLKFKNFNNALTRLKDLEFFELEVEIPVDVELFTLIKTSKVTTNELSLCQIQWVNDKRTAKIKAILPEKESIGVLQIFAGAKGLQKHFDNIHELAIVIPLYHTGIYRPCKFVPRFPTVQSQNNDLYIKQPQTSKIIVKNAYNFEIIQYPSQGLNSGSGLMNQDFKIVIESPSGKYFKLIKQDPLKPYGTYETNINCQEIGLYRGLVIGDSGSSWYVFAQWECVPGTVTN